MNTTTDIQARKRTLLNDYEVALDTAVRDPSDDNRAQVVKIETELAEIEATLRKAKAA